MSAKSAVSSLSRLLIGVLVRRGITAIIASPGSRSTPYLSAALEHDGVRVHMVIDERSAGYVALGLARATTRPVALLCTSGTAAANFFPAVVEARLSGIPLIVLTADRPMTLQGCSAPQTIDQTRLYGSHVLGSISLTVPTEGDEELVCVRRQILSVLALAQGVERGPVHINLHTPKPLELVEATSDERRQIHSLLDAVPESPDGFERAVASAWSERAVLRLVAAVERERRGIVTCGFEPERAALDPQILARFGRATGFAILLDAAHPLRLDSPPELRPYLVAPFEPLLRLDEWQENQAPKLVIQIGRPLLSGAFDKWLHSNSEQTRIERILILARSGWPDPTGRAELLGHGDPNDALERALCHLETSSPRSSGWGARWLRASGAVEQSVGLWSKTTNKSPEELGELTAVLAVLEAVPRGSRLVIGNSLAIREIDLLATTRITGIKSEALRGASGIDGVVSAAAGFALANDVGTTLLVGDISLLHDVGGLWAAANVSSPLAIVVLNNGGGRIFEQLPVASAVGASALAHWTTPQQLDLASAANLYGLPYLRATSTSLLTDAIREAHGHPGATLIEAVVASDSPRRQSGELMDVVQASLHRAGLLLEASLR